MHVQIITSFFLYAQLKHLVFSSVGVKKWWWWLGGARRGGGRSLIEYPDASNEKASAKNAGVVFPET